MSPSSQTVTRDLVRPIRRLLRPSASMFGAICMSVAPLIFSPLGLGTTEASDRVGVVIRPSSPIVGMMVMIEVRGAFSARVKPHVEAVSPGGRTTRISVRWLRRSVWRGAFRFETPGVWKIRVSPDAPRGPFYSTVRVRPPSSTPPPAEFGRLGRPACMPPSPRHRGATVFPAIGEVFGTTIRGELWALFASLGGGEWASPDSAVVRDVVGEELKIVFRFTGSFGGIFALGPRGERLLPVWGPRAHTGSDWKRPGSEWGTGFVLSEPGCWRLRMGDGTVVGDVWLNVLS